MSIDAQAGMTCETLWGIPLASALLPDAAAINAELLRAFTMMRRFDPRPGAATEGPFYASADDLLTRCDLAELHTLFAFIGDRLGAVVSSLNRQAWQDHGVSGASIAIAGSWFQVQNEGAFHDVHTHGNCSWSGVYYVDIDPASQRQVHPVYGARNGMLRFYGPWWDQLAGAFIDAGNTYLTEAHRDIAPEPGLLVLFPSSLKHQAFPYAGTRDRVAISFNATVEADGNTAFKSYDFS
ncbi:MAG: hypothetical protein ACI8WM_000277 [Burkholderiaceae bacterium]|jgi:hypothetical protein